jgi:hypothetical protein
MVNYCFVKCAVVLSYFVLTKSFTGSSVTDWCLTGKRSPLPPIQGLPARAGQLPKYKRPLQSLEVASCRFAGQLHDLINFDLEPTLDSTEKPPFEKGGLSGFAR